MASQHDFFFPLKLSICSTSGISWTLLCIWWPETLINKKSELMVIDHVSYYHQCSSVIQPFIPPSSLREVWRFQRGNQKPRHVKHFTFSSFYLKRLGLLESIFERIMFARPSTNLPHLVFIRKTHRHHGHLLVWTNNFVSSFTNVSQFI